MGVIGQAVPVGTTQARTAAAELGPRTATMADAGIGRGRTMALLDAGVLPAPEAELNPQAVTAAIPGPERW
jgi:hypothetical protein